MSDRVKQKINEYNEKGLANTLRSENESKEDNESPNKAKKFKPIRISNEGLELIEYLSLDCASNDDIWHSNSEIKIDSLGYAIFNGVKTKNFWDGSIKCDKKPLRLKIRNICGDESIWPIS